MPNPTPTPPMLPHHRYEAESNHDAAEIVAKLQYLIKLHRSQKLPTSRLDSGMGSSALLDERAAMPLHKRDQLRSPAAIGRRRSSASQLFQVQHQIV